jgi:hypothetical protein
MKRKQMLQKNYIRHTGPVFLFYQDSTEFFFRSSLGFLVPDEERESKPHGESKQFTFSLFLCVFQFTFSFLVYFQFIFGLLLRVFEFTFSVYFYPCFGLISVYF